jgi:hypothetical protein
MLIGLYGFWRRDIAILFTALGFLGLHSTLFGPVKYAILPQQLKPEELVGGNGLVEMGTFVAILIGTIVGGLVVAIEGSGPVAAGAVAVGVAVAGYLASRAIPSMPPVDPGVQHRDRDARAGQPTPGRPEGRRPDLADHVVHQDDGQQGIEFGEGDGDVRIVDDGGQLPGGERGGQRVAGVELPDVTDSDPLPQQLRLPSEPITDPVLEVHPRLLRTR